ncbi:uncharacterized protein LOC131597358 [Vicia villosa]|uniref:uncharacterized protein LOC131597358 n=1 Tax=Vicia villosa TaxID=3911 RepID=UPI00273C9D97|nr:uncharacterized protein LOC131597358 [Vicia villosa]
MAAHCSQFQEETRNNQRNTTASIKNLEVQMGLIAQHLTLQTQGTLLSSTVKNPKDQENVNAVTTNDNFVIEVDLEVRENPKEPKIVALPIKPLEEKNKKYAKPKFMKEVIAKKRPVGGEPEIVIEKCSRVSPDRKIPIKKKDPRAVAIPCTIKDKMFKKVLIDSDSSVSLMSLSIFKKLDLGKISENGKKLKFADQTIMKSYGVTEDVLEIDKFVFPMEFHIMDIPEDEETSILLGRSFMLTSCCNFDIEKETLKVKSFDEEITLKVLEVRKQVACGHNQSSVGMIEIEGENKIPKPLPEKVSCIVSQVELAHASIKSPKDAIEVKKKKK